MVLRKVEGAGDGGRVDRSRGQGRAEGGFPRGETGRSNSCARIARLGRRVEKGRKEEEKKEDEDALKTELAEWNNNIKMDRAGPQVLRYTATRGKDVAAGAGWRRQEEGGTGGNTDRRRLTVTQEAFSSFPNHPNFALGIAQGESIRGHPRLALFHPAIST